MADEFGDSSFLDDFDVDAAVLQDTNNKRSSPASSSGGLAPSSDKKKAKKMPLVENFAEKVDDAATTTNGTATPISSSSIQQQQKQPAISDYSTPTHKPLLTKALRETLQQYFGYDNFRSGQLDVIKAVLEQRDCAVFWATGSGKSLCYQIPALHTGHISLVVSPLISLMQDQVHKLNALSGKELATFLGSGQLDSTMEDRALQGEFPLVYVTPEKLLSGNFLDRLERCHSTIKRLLMIAVDESHCVSEWGHDFRLEYRKLHQVRSSSVLSQVPILALTATAVPRVQQDIITNLQLRNPFLARSSFDRDNLAISIMKKKSGGVHGSLSFLLPKLKDGSSTICYVPTRDGVMEVANYLASKLGEVTVEPYHAGLTPQQRHEAHTNFLVGRTKIICATSAFGLGIDKPDTRRVLHYGPPKTMEEYYQQVGRAGRDGLPAECIMLVTNNDFDRYRSDFYIKKSLPAATQKTMIDSLNALKGFALDCQTCRRKALLDFFHEVPAFGEFCGTCDVCSMRENHADDLERDLGPDARIILKAAWALRDATSSVLEKVIGGKVVEGYRYARGVQPGGVQSDIQTLRDAMTRKKPLSYFKELYAPLIQKGYLVQGTKEFKVPGSTFSRTATTYCIAQKGRTALNDTSVSIMLPVPQSIRDLERQEEEKIAKRLALLEKSGVKMENIPKAEMDAGDGEVIRAFSKWHSYLDSLERNNRQDRIQQLEDLRLRIDAWRMDSAAKHVVAPSTVLAEHLVVSIAYTTASMSPGMKVSKEALVSIGVRIKEIDGLVLSLGEWVDDVQPAGDNDASGSSASHMVLEDSLFTPQAPWEFAVYKPAKKTGLATWESSLNRFMEGEHPQSIAMAPASGRPIQVATVVGHILQGVEQGRQVNLFRLKQVTTPPTMEEWNELERCAEVTQMNVTGDPSTSGKDGERFTMTDFLCPIMGEQFIATPYQERDEADSAKFGRWCGLLKWYITLKRSGYKPEFSRGSDDLRRAV